MIAQEEEKELLISFSNTNRSDIVISIYYENEKIKLVKHYNNNSFFWVSSEDDLKKIVTNIMDTWCYDTNTYYYNLEYGESLVYGIWDFEIR